jgi:hypothetical protein
MRTTNILLGVICAVLAAQLALTAYPRFERWRAEQMAEKAAYDAAELNQTMRAIHAFSAECKGREQEPDCRIVAP